MCTKIIKLIVVLLCSFFMPMAHATGLGPWDNILSVSSKKAVGAIRCKNLSDVASTGHLEGYYRKDQTQNIDKEKFDRYRRDSESVRTAVRYIVDSADRFVSEKDGSAALCVLEGLRELAKRDVMSPAPNSPQGYYFRTWMLNAIAVSYLKVRSFFPESDKDVISWMSGIAENTMRYWDARFKRSKTINNLHYWAGAAVISVGVLADRSDFVDWAQDVFVIGADKIKENGLITTELGRKSRALHYNNFALGPLVWIAYLSDLNSDDVAQANNCAVFRAAQTTLTGLEDSSLFVSATGMKQEVSKRGINLAWLDLLRNWDSFNKFSTVKKEFGTGRDLYLGGSMDSPQRSDWKSTSCRR